MNKHHEIVCEGKTFVTKKMNIVRKALVLKSIVSGASRVQSLSTNLEEMNEDNIEVVADLMLKLPELMWMFIKDEDKQVLGTYDNFVDGIDEQEVSKFLEWVINIIKEEGSLLNSKPNPIRETQPLESK